MNSLFDQHQLDTMIGDPRNYKWGFFYFNKQDSRIIVPKRQKFMGWSFNYAKPMAYIILLLIYATAIFLINIEKILK